MGNEAVGRKLLRRLPDALGQPEHVDQRLAGIRVGREYALRDQVIDIAHHEQIEVGGERRCQIWKRLAQENGRGVWGENREGTVQRGRGAGWQIRVHARWGEIRASKPTPTSKMIGHPCCSESISKRDRVNKSQAIVEAVFTQM